MTICIFPCVIKHIIFAMKQTTLLFLAVGHELIRPWFVGVLLCRVQLCRTSWHSHRNWLEDRTIKHERLRNIWMTLESRGCSTDCGRVALAHFWQVYALNETCRKADGQKQRRNQLVDLSAVPSEVTENKLMPVQKAKLLLIPPGRTASQPYVIVAAEGRVWKNMKTGKPRGKCQVWMSCCPSLFTSFSYVRLPNLQVCHWSIIKTPLPSVFFLYVLSPRLLYTIRAVKIGDRKRCLKGASSGTAERWQAGGGHLPAPCKHSSRQRLQAFVCVSSLQRSNRTRTCSPSPFPPTQGQNRMCTQERRYRQIA